MIITKNRKIMLYTFKSQDNILPGDLTIYEDDRVFFLQIAHINNQTLEIECCSYDERIKLINFEVDSSCKEMILKIT